jgi:predicted ATP-dependent serine protease
MSAKDDELAAQLTQVEPWSAYREKADRMNVEMGTTVRYKTKWPEFNDYLGGGFGSSEHGELVVIMGDTGLGKSTFAANLAVHLISTSKEKIHYISLENSPEEMYNVVRRVLKREALGEVEAYFTSPPKKLIFEGEGLNAENLLAHMKYVTKAYGKKLFILDHLNFMFENEEQAANELNRVRVIMRQLSKFCMNNDATVFAISHINKKPDTKSKTPKYLTLDRIYGSQAIAGAATKVLALNEITKATPRLIDVQMLKTRFTPGRGDAVAQFQIDGYEWRFVGSNLL